MDRILIRLFDLRTARDLPMMVKGERVWGWVEYDGEDVVNAFGLKPHKDLGFHDQPYYGVERVCSFLSKKKGVGVAVGFIFEEDENE